MAVIEMAFAREEDSGIREGGCLAGVTWRGDAGGSRSAATRACRPRAGGRGHSK
jgi:hypothetical protein